MRIPNTSLVMSFIIKSSSMRKGSTKIYDHFLLQKPKVSEAFDEEHIFHKGQIGVENCRPQVTREKNRTAQNAGIIRIIRFQ